MMIDAHDPSMTDERMKQLEDALGQNLKIQRHMDAKDTLRRLRLQAPVENIKMPFGGYKR